MVEKTQLKKRQKSMIGKGIQTEGSDSHGKTVSTDLKEKSKAKIVSVGECPECHKEFVRPYPIDTAVCTCQSATEVPLEPAIVVSKRRYVLLENLANRADVTVERLVEVLLDTYIDELYQKGLVNLVNLVKK